MSAGKARHPRATSNLNFAVKRPKPATPRAIISSTAHSRLPSAQKQFSIHYDSPESSCACVFVWTCRLPLNNDWTKICFLACCCAPSHSWKQQFRLPSDSAIRGSASMCSVHAILCDFFSVGFPTDAPNNSDENSISLRKGKKRKLKFMKTSSISLRSDNGVLSLEVFVQVSRMEFPI